MNAIGAEWPQEEVKDLPSLCLRLSQVRGMEEIMEELRTATRRLTGADGVSFILREGDNCYYADEDAIAPLWKGQRFPMDICLSGWAMRNRQTVVIEDIYEDARIPHDAYRHTFVRSLVMVPVRQDDPVAAIGAYWASRRRASPAEVSLLEGIANAAAVAITNVALYRSLTQTAEDARRQAAAAETQAQMLAKAKAELELANAQMSHFLAACSHDLRQPFQAMRLFHTLLADRVSGADREVVRRLGEAMSHGEELLQALLEVASLDSGLTGVTRAPFAVNELLERLSLGFSRQAEKKGLRLRVVPCRRWIDSDAGLLTHLLSNLLANAVKFTRQGSILLGTRRRGDDLSIEIWDSGIGIPPEQLEKIFHDFYQIGNPQRDKRCGLGLGLGVVRRLADKLGHPVTVRSIPGRGSVFAVRVPLAP